VAYSLAIGETRRLSTCYVSNNVVGSSMHAIDRPERDRVVFEPQHVQGVVVDTLDNLVCKEQFRVPNHIKIDVDGVENLVVSGMSGLLDDDRLHTIMIEIESVISKGKIEKQIESTGFCEGMKGQWNDNSIYNVLYVRQSKLTLIQDH